MENGVVSYLSEQFSVNGEFEYQSFFVFCDFSILVAVFTVVTWDLLSLSPTLPMTISHTRSSMTHIHSLNADFYNMTYVALYILCPLSLCLSYVVLLSLTTPSIFLTACF